MAGAFRKGIMSEAVKASAPVIPSRRIADPVPQAAPFIDRREAVDKQRTLDELISQSPRQLAQRAATAVIHGEPVQRRTFAQPANRTGMPDALKSGIEAMSGMDMSDVRVHRNSAMPAQLNAYAYAQGSDIHLGPGQEHHLPHEAWHVVQQRRGQVAETTRVAGASVNDDAALERDADVMGAKALQMRRADTEAPLQGVGAGGAAGQVMPARHPVPSSAPVQRQVALVLAPAVVAPQGPTFAASYNTPGGPQQSGLTVDIDWVTPMQTMYQIIATVRPTLDDDEDLAALQAHENAADVLAGRGNLLVAEFDGTARFGRVNVAGRLNALRLEVILELAGLQQQFQLTEGGFGAKGRAAAIPTAVGARGQAALTADDTFIANVTLNNTLLTNHFRVQKDAAFADAGPQRLRVAGADHATNGLGLNLHQRATALAQLEGGLAAVQNGQVDNISAFAARARDQGQEAGMGNTNARGYAWLTNTPGWNTTRWEWLHIRGASLGGATNATNLVLGTRDSNTHMIPFESNLKALTTIIRDNRALYDGLTVNWTVAGQVHPHKYNQITIDWRINRAPGAGADVVQPDGRVQFSPLNIGSVISKGEVEFLEGVLKNVRDNIERAGEDAEDDDYDMGGEDAVDDSSDISDSSDSDVDEEEMNEE
jgi:hypothetical protein